MAFNDRVACAHLVLEEQCTQVEVVDKGALTLINFVEHSRRGCSCVALTLASSSHQRTRMDSLDANHPRTTSLTWSAS